MGHPWWPSSRESACSAGDPGAVPGSGRSLEKGMAAHSVFLPGKFHGQRSLVGYSPWGCKESGMTEQLSTHIIALQRCVRFYRTEKWVSDMYTYIPSSLDSLPVYTEHWVGVPVLWSRFSSVIYFMHSIVSMSIPVSQFIPPLPSLFVLYICVSISALQISSSVAFF